MPAEERKLVTVLFADLVGSTELASDQDPERVRAMLDHFYDLMSEEIERAGGTIEKFVGDAVMAAFGAPVAHEDDAERALHVALAMQRRMADRFGGRLGLRVGVNTGDVVVGRPREGSSFVTGDAVNVCARLEQAAGPGEVLVGERTAAAALGAFEFADAMTVEAKGKAAGVRCRRLVRALSMNRARGIRGQGPIFVGREDELGALRRTYEGVVADGVPQLSVVVGDPGVGKSRLMHELWQVLGQQAPQPLLRAGRCLSYGQGITYWPLGEVVKEQFAILDGDAPATIAARLDSWSGLELTLGLPPPVGMHPLLVRDHLHGAWLAFVQDLAAERPVVLLIEDAHWAEPDLCDLIDAMVERVTGPLLVLVTARPEVLDRQPGWRGRLVRLGAFDSVDTAALVESILGAECPGDVRELILSRADGNPFFVEELVSTLIDHEVLERIDSSWTFRPLPVGLAVPDTIHAVLAARIDFLPAAQKAVLQAAAVIGRVFWAGPVAELLEDPAPDLELLEQREFIQRRAGSSIVGEREYTIKHALTREVAYDSLLKAKRAPLHARFARWLEAQSDVGEHAALLAHHYAEAVRPEDLDVAWFGREQEAEQLRGKALSWLRQAADLAIARYEMDDGIGLLHRAVELEPDPALQAELWQRIGRANAMKFDGDAFWKAMNTAIELGGPADDLYAELAFQSTRRWGMWRQQPEAGLIRGWIDEALKLAEEGSRNQALALYARSGWDEADESAARSLAEIADRRGELDLRALADTALASQALAHKDIDTARAVIASLLDLVPRLTDPDDQTRSLLDVVMTNVWLGDLGNASIAATLSVELARGLTPHHRLHGAAGQALIAALSGDWEVLRGSGRRTERAVDDNTDTPCPQNVSALLHCALASVYLGDPHEASRLEAKAAGIGMAGWRFWLDPPRIRLAIARNDLEALPPLLDRYMEEVNGIEAPSAYFDGLLAIGDRTRIEQDAGAWIRPGSYAAPFAMRALGWARQDSALLDKAVERFREMRLAWHAEKTERLR